MAFFGVPRYVAGEIARLQLSSAELILLLLVFYIILGCFLEGMSAIVMTLPVVLPVVLAAGYSKIWLGVFLVLVIEMAPDNAAGRVQPICDPRNDRGEHLAYRVGRISILYHHGSGDRTSRRFPGLTTVASEPSLLITPLQGRTDYGSRMEKCEWNEL